MQPKSASHLIAPDDLETLDVMGPTITFLTPPDQADDLPCLMRGTIPPGGAVPLHNHGDPETFVAESGEVEGLTETPDGFRWLRIVPGDMFHVPGGAKHALRNPGSVPSVTLVVSTCRLGRFFREVAEAIGTLPPGPPSEAVLRRFRQISDRYGYWNATPEESARAALSAAGP